MGFIDSYKRLEKLCGQILDDGRRLSAYIDEMVNTPDGSLYVPDWENDLKTLKHYRWIRNKISHDPECNEENMCNPEDEFWLNDFYYRIMNQTDPLSLYRKTHTTIKRSCPSYTNKTYIDESHQQKDSDYKELFFWVIAVIMAILVLASGSLQ